VNRDKHDELNELGLNQHELEKMEQLLGEFRQASNAQATQPELFWTSMRTRVAARMRAPQSHKGLGWAATLAAVSAMVVFVAVPARHVDVKVNPTTATNQHATTNTAKTLTNDDEALLRAVADTTSSDVPDALAPATILTSEMDRGLADANKLTGRNTQ
jgi:hypothetical protein